MSFTYRKDILDNGVRVVTESSKDAGSVALGFWVGVGASQEPPHLSGVSHFIEHMLFKGTKRRSSFQIANALESVGGSIDAFAGRESTAYVSRCLAEHLRKAVAVTGDMLSNPAMEESAIETEKRVVIEEIRNFEDTPEEVVHEHLARSVWKSDSMASPILGSVDSINGLGRASIRSFFEAAYVAPNVIVAASGKVNHRELVDYVDGSLTLPVTPGSIEVNSHGDALPRVFHDKREVSQCYICLGAEGVPYAERRRYPAMLLSILLGGGMTSRLFQEVRERHGLAYSVYCSCEFYRRTGIFLIFLAVDPKKARKAVRRVATELRRFKRDGVTRTELRGAKRQLKGSMVLGLESTSARMTRLARHEFYLQDWLPLEQSIKNVMAVTNGQLMAESRQLLRPSRFSLVVVGPPWTDFPGKTDLVF
jgi:predicted Zn-dependent peptidase